MKNKKNNDVSGDNKYEENSSKIENKINKSHDEGKSLSLKYQCFETFSKKNSNIPQINKLRKNNYINQKENQSSSKRNNNLIDFSIIKKVINFHRDTSNISKDRYNLNTYSNIEKDINININDSLKKNSFKYIINANKNKDKIISPKNKISNDQNKKEENNNLENIIQINQKIFQPKSNSSNYSNEIKSHSINANKSRNNNNLFLKHHNSQKSEGYLVRRELNGIPVTFEPIMVYNNLYSNKSEKKRHEIILDEFTKLRQYIERQPEKKFLFIKEFLKKYHIEYGNFSNNQLLSLCNFICFHDNNVISSILKPYLNIKNMIIELINNIYIVNNLLGIKQSMKNNEIKEAINSEEMNSNEDNKYFEDLCRYSSPNYLENIENKNSENFKIKYYTKENVRKNKYENNITDNEEVLKEIKIKLRDLDHQKKLHYPDKNYPFRNDLIIKDMNKEMVLLKNNFEQSIYNKSFPLRKYLNTENNCNNDSVSSKIKNAITFSEFNKKPKNLKKIEKEIYNKFITTQRINNNNSNKFILMKKDDSFIKKNNISNIKNNNKYSMDEIIKRLYYNPMKIGFDLNQIKKSNKMTEYYALKFAKHNKFLIDINNNNYFHSENYKNRESQNYILKDI